MSDTYDKTTVNSTFLSDRNSRLWNFLSTDGDESSIDHLLTTYGMVPQAANAVTGCCIQQTNNIPSTSSDVESICSVSSCFESNSSFSDNSDTSYYHIDSKPTKSTKYKAKELKKPSRMLGTVLGL